MLPSIKSILLATDLSDNSTEAFKHAVVLSRPEQAKIHLLARSRARAVEPGNPALSKRASEVEAARAAGRITVPSTLGEELSVNPFLRTREAAVIQAARQRDPSAEPGASTLAVIRAWKDSF